MTFVAYFLKRSCFVCETIIFMTSFAGFVIFYVQRQKLMTVLYFWLANYTFFEAWTYWIWQFFGKIGAPFRRTGPM